MPSSGGTSQGQTFERWDSLRLEPGTEALIKWGLPKSRRRAVEKLYRCYRMDASRLLDCCRQVVELTLGPESGG